MSTATEQEDLAFLLELFGVHLNSPVDVGGALGRLSILGGGCAVAHGYTKAEECCDCYNGMVVAQPQELVQKKKGRVVGCKRQAVSGASTLCAFVRLEERT